MFKFFDSGYTAYDWSKEHHLLLFTGVFYYYYFSLVFYFSAPQIRLITKEKKLKLVERDPLKPFLLQNGTKESTKGMDRPWKK